MIVVPCGLPGIPWRAFCLPLRLETAGGVCAFIKQGAPGGELLNPRRCGTVTCPAPFFIPHYTAEVLRFFHSLLTVRAHRFFNSPFFHGREGLPSFSGQAKTSSLFIVLAGIRSCKSIIRSVRGFVHEKNVKSCKRNRKTKN